jgi:glycosyltransferase involved in cell wall biosynthesis
MQVSFALCFEGQLSSALKEAGATVHHLGALRAARPWTVIRARRALLRLLQSDPADVLLFHGCWCYGLLGAVARRARVPAVLFLHDVFKGRHWTERLARRIEPQLLLCNSTFTAASARPFFSRVRQVYYPVVPPTGAEGVSRDHARTELATPANAVVIIQTSRMERYKGHLMHLEALGQLRSDAAWICWIAGGAQRPDQLAYVEELKAKAARLGIEDRVTFLGQRSDVGRLLTAADIHCQPNEGAEAFGIAFIEALLAGLPVVSVKMGGVEEIVDESCGVLVPPGDAVALAQALRSLINDGQRRRALGAAGPARARTLCEPNAQLAALAEILRSAISS